MKRKSLINITGAEYNAMVERDAKKKARAEPYIYAMCPICGWKPSRWQHLGRFVKHGHRRINGKWKAACAGSGMKIKNTYTIG